MKSNYLNLLFLSSMLLTTSLSFAQPKEQHKIKSNDMIETLKTDKDTLSRLNAQFIKNFINQDVKAHEQIIHRNFVCIENSGKILNRDEYMKEWATGFRASNLTSFSYADEDIRIFGNMALVRSKTIYTKIADGKTISGNSIYTDTYVKENERWWCVQAQITPIRN